jgi:hypothetical protein
MILKKITFFVFFINCWAICFALPEGPFPDAVFDRNIKTVQFSKVGWEFSYPILQFDDERPLLLSFDDMNTNYKNFNYAIIHCDADWMPSRLSYSEYLDGFYQNPVTEYHSSFSTHVPYTHYSLEIPNENVKLKLSGNYILIVYQNSDEDNPVFIKRFVLVEPRVNIVPDIKRPSLPAYQNACQEIDFSILYGDFPLENPYQTVKVKVIKNNQWKFSNEDLKPIFVRNTELVYDYEDKNLFLGGNEYRAFDTKSLRYQSANIQSIEFDGAAWQVMLKPDNARAKFSYFYNEDLNGKYLIQNQGGTDASVDAEYVHILFNFSVKEPVAEGNVYVYGGLSDYNCYDDNKMKYNAANKAYELDLLVKQGYYNYQYVYVPNSSADVDERYFEGSFYETENDYVFYVYYRPFGSRYDSLIGVKIANSLHRS